LSSQFFFCLAGLTEVAKICYSSSLFFCWCITLSPAGSGVKKQALQSCRKKILRFLIIYD